MPNALPAMREYRPTYPVGYTPRAEPPVTLGPTPTQQVRAQEYAQRLAHAGAEGDAFRRMRAEATDRPGTRSAKRRACQDRVLDLLRDTAGAMTVDQIADRLGEDRSRVLSLLESLAAPAGAGPAVCHHCATWWWHRDHDAAIRLALGDGDRGLAYYTAELRDLAARTRRALAQSKRLDTGAAR